ncbi:hypothetical protein [Alishewanella jeotgali]|uniref:Uncharacterized protein n=1 Tax=Alishewanella jeotgali KCTC 22429 TaxID=1129374 RepID=H3ZJ69_9ALTE|nr:hypothetical protein [Alishewanella jeotgali]EHR39375.1 hypothetical protein AJE_17175 [Alishewanella jeotgali KCTC 22429]
MRIVSGDKNTTHAALPPSDANKRQPCAKLKRNQPGAIQRNDWNPKNLLQAEPINQRNNATAPSEIAPAQQTGEPDGIN